MGYAEIAKLMGKHPEVAIFRRFAFLNTKNLLYLQAELMVLEDELNDLIKEDIERETEESKTKPKTDIVIPDRDWEDLTKAPAQWQKFKDIRKKLKEYNETLHLQVITSALDKPKGHELEVLRKMLKYSDGDKSGLRGEDRSVWDKVKKQGHLVNPDDLVVIKVPMELDFLTNLFMSIILFFKTFGFRRKLREVFDMEKSNTAAASNSNVTYDDKCVYVEDSKLYEFVSKITTVISCVLPVTSIVALYFVHDLGTRLGLIAAFMVVFALILALTTDARRTDIFTATAGFAAILVVFVGSTS